MQTAAFGDFPRGTLCEMLTEAYAANPPLVRENAADFQTFDDFVYDTLKVLERCGFVSVEAGTPVGFITWDPRQLPQTVQIGHNCILPPFRGQGLGKAQLGMALMRIRPLHPREITVITGGSGFFLPARKMYEACGFTEYDRRPDGQPAETERVWYRLVTQDAAQTVD